MRRYVTILLSLLIALPLFAAGAKKGKKKPLSKTTKLPRVNEPIFNNNTLGPNHRFGPKVTYSNRDSDWYATLIDSSLNGYGAYNPIANPLAYALDEGYVAVYRQFQGLDVTAGYIGSSQSEDGEEWFTEQTLNQRYPTGEEEPNLPTATGTPQGRYPSAGFAPGGNPTAIWNEYTNADQGGGQYGGFPLYSYDSEGIGEFSAWVNPFPSNNGCGTVPCDPPDLWNGNGAVNTGDNGPVFTALYDGWSDTPSNYYWITSSFHANGYFLMNDPYVLIGDGDVDDDGGFLWQDGGNYTSSPDYHINQDGVGYLVQTSYAEDPGNGDPRLHTMFFKKTEDYGETWTNDGGYKNSGYHFIPDEVMMELSDSLWTMYSENADDDAYATKLWYPGTMCDSIDEESGDTLFDELYCGDSVYYVGSPPLVLTPGLFMWYNMDVRTDADGGMHFITQANPIVCHDTLYSAGHGCDDNDGDGLADSTEQWPYSSSGHYYFYNPDPIDDPTNWSVDVLSDYDDNADADWDISDIFFINSLDGYGPWYYMYPEITFSAEDGSEVMWYGSFKGSAYAENPADSNSVLPVDIDIFMRKSTDLGKTWTDLENVTNSLGGIYPDKQLEVSVHLANTATDDEVAVFYQMPDFSTETYPPATGYEDFMNRVYVGIYSNDASSGGTVTVGDEKISPNEFSLKQNYPNPFNPKTQIKFSINKSGDVVLDLFDIRGAKIKSLINKYYEAGSHVFTLDGSSLASGVYFYSLTVNGETKTRKLALMK